MQRIAQVEQNIRAGETIEQLAPRHSDAAHSRQVVGILRGRLMQQTVTAAESMLAQLPLELPDSRLIFARIGGGRQQLEPDRIESEPAQSEHPLQRHGKIPAAFRIFRREATTEEDGHAKENREQKPAAQRPISQFGRRSLKFGVDVEIRVAPLPAALSGMSLPPPPRVDRINFAARSGHPSPDAKKRAENAGRRSAKSQA